MSTLAPRIYVACLASYNAGVLHGEWIDAAQDPDQIFAEIKDMLEASSEEIAEEFAIHDYDDFGGVSICEYESIKKVSAIGLFLEEHGEVGAAVLSHHDEDVDAAETTLENGYGEYSDVGAYAQQLTEYCGGDIPDYLAPYIDYDAMGRDMELNGDVFTINAPLGNVYVFTNC